jgi:hypothetical protein
VRRPLPLRLEEGADLLVLLAPRIEHAGVDADVARRALARVPDHHLEFDGGFGIGPGRALGLELELQPGPRHRLRARRQRRVVDQRGRGHGLRPRLAPPAAAQEQEAAERRKSGDRHEIIPEGRDLGGLAGICGRRGGLQRHLGRRWRLAGRRLGKLEDVLRLRRHRGRSFALRSRARRLGRRPLASAGGRRRRLAGGGRLGGGLLGW